MSAAPRSTNAGSLLPADALALLRLLDQHGGKVPMVRLRALDPGPVQANGRHKVSTQSRVTHLRTERMVKAYKPTPREAMVVEITHAGRQALLATVNAPGGQVASTSELAAKVVDLERLRASRAAHQERMRPDSYDGAELSKLPPRGAESLRAYTLPSLVNGQRIERTRAPIIMASTRPDRLQDGRGRA